MDQTLTMEHGGDLSAARARFGGGPRDWLDLSTGINPHAYPLPALDDAVWRRLPDAALEARFVAVARSAYGVEPGAVLVPAPGTQALIQWIPLVLPEGPVAIVGPTYAEHALAWARAGRDVIPITPEHLAAGRLPAAARHLVIVSPNNPDGHRFPAGTFGAIARDVSERGGTLIVDESFLDVENAPSTSAFVPRFSIGVLRSFGKFHGLAGLRLGAFIAPPALAAAMAAALGPWAVSGPALAIGAAALADRAWAEAMRGQLAAEAASLDAVLGAAGLPVVGGTSLYRLVRHAQARAIHGALASRRIWVRRFDWDDGLLRFGLPPDGAALERLSEALWATVNASMTERAHAALQGMSTA
jgi:cobalamin biosynthetic protein CobC